MSASKSRVDGTRVGVAMVEPQHLKRAVVCIWVIAPGRTPYRHTRSTDTQHRHTQITPYERRSARAWGRALRRYVSDPGGGHAVTDPGVQGVQGGQGGRQEPQAGVDTRHRPLLCVLCVCVFRRVAIEEGQKGGPEGDVVGSPVQLLRAVAQLPPPPPSSSHHVIIVSNGGGKVHV